MLIVESLPIQRPNAAAWFTSVLRLCYGSKSEQFMNNPGKGLHYGFARTFHRRARKTYRDAPACPRAYI
jgi:hypothetical protein